jgi:hypothetical protein
MGVKSDKRPDYYGHWSDKKSLDSNLFFIYITKGRGNIIFGDILDKYGRSIFFGNMDKDKVKFNRDYTTNSSPDSTPYTLAYEGRINLPDIYKGKYKCNDKNGDKACGKFLLRPFDDSQELNSILNNFRRKYSF